MTPEQETFERIRANQQMALERKLNKVEDLQKKLAECEPDSMLAERYSRILSNTQRDIVANQGIVEFMRMPNEEDLTHRGEIRRTFPEAVRNAIPDGVPMVFHGSSNQGVIREIIKSGGLLTPEQRGVDMTSFAPAIDVGYKNEIIAPCEFADKDGKYMPYGAIFAFMPKEEEYENVLRTGRSTEVAGGLDGVNFREEPDRLISIITTQENTERIQGWCNEYGWEPDKVQTHEEFLQHCKELFPPQQSAGLQGTIAPQEPIAPEPDVEMCQ